MPKANFALVARVLAFYRDLLGMEVDFVTSFSGDKADRIMALDNAAARIVMLNAGNARIELFEFTFPRRSRAIRSVPSAIMALPTSAWTFPMSTENISALPG